MGKKYLPYTEFYFILRYTGIEVHTFTCLIKYTKLLSLKFWKEYVKVVPQVYGLSIWWYHLLRKEEQILELKVINSVLGEKLKYISFGR